MNGLTNHNINNLQGGVSQQSDELRYDNQVKSMVNYMVTVSQGLRRRNPISLLDNTTSNHTSDMAIHSYSRGDGLRKYGMTLNANGLKIYEPAQAGTANFEKTVHVIGSDVVTAWAGANWKTDIEFITVGDTTWALNKKQIVAASAPTTPTVVNRAFYWVKRSFDASPSDTNGYAYELIVDGVSYATNHENSLSVIAGLKSALELDGYTVKTSGSTMVITRATPFTFEYGDSWGNQASFGWTTSVAKIADLPSDLTGLTESDVGTISIVGTDRDKFTNYYLKWTGEYWTETFKEGFDIVIDKTTMPCKLIQVDDNTFEFGFVGEYTLSDAPISYTAGQKDAFVLRWNEGWEKRWKGDEDSAPTPSFVGSTISNMFFFKNRLGFTSEDNIILSEAGQYYNFFPTTAMDILDSDPIDAGIDSNTVSIIRNVNATSGALTLWADNAQFLLSGGEILSPATTRISQTSSYSVSNNLKPLDIDNEILFFNANGSWLEVMTYNPASLQADKSSAEKLSSHIPEYVPANIDTACVSTVNNLVFLFSKSNPNDIYVYKYFVSNQERKISAWFKWTFAETIIDIDVIDNNLMMMANTNDVLVMDLEPLDITGTFLDRGVTTYQSDVILSRYNVITNQDSMTIREPFYMKNIKVKKQGKVDFVIINNERAKETIVNNKHLGRKLVVGGNTEKVDTGFRTSYDVGCEINTISLEGRLQMKSRNI